MLTFFIVTGSLFLAGIWIGCIVTDDYWSRKYAAYKRYSSQNRRMASEFARGFAAGQNALYNDHLTRAKK